MTTKKRNKKGYYKAFVYVANKTSQHIILKTLLFAVSAFLFMLKNSISAWTTVLS